MPDSQMFLFFVGFFWGRFAFVGFIYFIFFSFLGFVKYSFSHDAWWLTPVIADINYVCIYLKMCISVMVVSIFITTTTTTLQLIFFNFELKNPCNSL